MLVVFNKANCGHRYRAALSDEAARLSAPLMALTFEGKHANGIIARGDTSHKSISHMRSFVFSELNAYFSLCALHNEELYEYRQVTACCFSCASKHLQRAKRRVYWVEIGQLMSLMFIWRNA